jgi:GDPmannose 4,6-dehydratase
MPGHTTHVNALGVLYFLEAIRSAELTHTTRFYQASTSELFGKVSEIPQKETTSFYPRSPYAVSKLYAYWIVKNYRESYGMFACNGILFNHESPMRGSNFVTRKITKAVAARALGHETVLHLGNLDAKRDWGHAKDYVRAMVLMLQHHEADDFIIATGVTYSVRQCVEQAFAVVGIPLVWSGSGLQEKGINALTGALCVIVDPSLFRPCEVDILCGDATKAQTILGWKPQITFKEMIAEMVRHDYSELQKNNMFNGKDNAINHEYTNNDNTQFFDHAV